MSSIRKYLLKVYRLGFWDGTISVLAFASVFALLVFFTSCKTCIPVVEYRDSVRTEYKLDSTYVYVHDSVYRDRWRNGDTIFVTTEKWQVRWRDKVVVQHDTIRTTDKVVQEVKVVPKFYKGCTIAMWILVVLIILGIVARILVRVYLKK